MKYQKLFKAVGVLSVIVLIVVILVYAKSFLIPLTFAALLSMLLLPITKWLQRKGAHKVLATIGSILVLVSFFTLIIVLVSWQVSDIASNASKIEQQLKSKYEQAQQFVSQKLGISAERQQQMVKQQQSGSSGRAASFFAGFMKGLGSFLANTILVLVYIFLFIYYRGRLKGFIVRLVPKEQEANALETVNQVQKVAQHYLTGLSIMIFFLWVMYAIGFSVVGVKNAFFFAILCGLLEIVPFIGNLTGVVITLTMSMVQGGGMNLVLGILITYAIVQFIQTYILETLVVGSEVSLNPLFTIVGLVAGETLWGIAGMILAIPLMGMAKIICDHVEPLQPYAYLIGQDKDQESKWKQKIKDAGKKLVDKFR